MDANEAKVMGFAGIEASASDACQLLDHAGFGAVAHRIRNALADGVPPSVAIGRAAYALEEEGPAARAAALLLYSMVGWFGAKGL